MRRISSLDDLAAALGGGQLSGRSLHARDVDIDSAVTVEGLHCERIEIRNLSTGGLLGFRHCHVDELLLTNCATDGLLLTDCRIGLLEIRGSSPQRPVVVAGGAFQSVGMHDVGDVTVERVHIASSLTLTGLRGKVRLRRMTAISVTVAEQLTVRSATDLVADEVTTTDNFEIRDLSGQDLVLNDCLVRRTLRLRRLRMTGRVEMNGCHCQGQVLAERIVVSDAVRLTRCSLREGMVVEGLSRVPRDGSDAVIMRIDRTSVGNALAVVVGAEPGDVLLANTLVSGQLQFPRPSARFVMSGTTSVADLEIPEEPVRSLAQLRGLTTMLFGEVSVAALSALRTALGTRRRLAEEDQCYFLQREAEADNDSGTARLVKKYVLGGVLGWGVRLRAPFRALLVGITLTALCLYGTGAVAVAEEEWGVAAAARSLAVAAALWLNVGTGVPQLLTSTAWTIAATALTALGLLLITVLVGVAIRKLVR